MDFIKDKKNNDYYKDNPILFVGFAVPQYLMNEIIILEKRQPQIAAHKLQWNIINGIEENIGHGIDLLSSVPVSDFPNYPKIMFGLNYWSHRGDVQDFYIPFINLTILKHISRFISAFMMISFWLLRHKRHKNNLLIIIYGMHSPHVVAAILGRWLFGGKIFLIVPDLPEFMDNGINRNVLRKFIKPLDCAILRKTAKKMNGLITLTKHIANDLAAQTVPYLVVEGAVSIDMLESGSHQVNNLSINATDKGERIIFYAGGLSSEYGVKILLDAFSLLPCHNYRLWLCGSGKMESAVKNAAMRDHRIIYWGVKTNSEVIQLEKHSTILINPRPSNNEFTKYSFPSKLLEFMASGRPVITTPLKGIPDDYESYVNILEDQSPAGLARFT